MDTREKVRESNRIERIHRHPSTKEIAQHDHFMSLPALTVGSLIAFVNIYQPGARLRNLKGLDVRVGTYYPPLGGEAIPTMLGEILNSANQWPKDAWQIHLRYENLHPFTDGNGRSGRALWYWCMHQSGADRIADLGFLHAFYYQTLQNVPAEKLLEGK